MNILKNVVNRIAESDKKTELASEKVELALLDDLQNEYNAALKDYDKQKKDAQSALSELKKIAENSKKTELKLMDWLVSFNKAEASAKDLGLNLPSNILKAEKEVVKKMNEASTMASVINKIKL